MKQLLLIVALCFVLSSDAQPYQRVFASSHTSWNVYSFNLGWDRTDTIYTSGDTVIDGLLYKSIISVANSTPEHIGYLHEDSVTGNLIFIDQSDLSQYTVMDLNLSVGDSFPFTPYTDLQVDSVYTLTGKKHIRFRGSHDSRYPIEFIEGMGPTTGINFMQYFFGMQRVLCAYQDSVQTYGSGPCYINHTRITSQLAGLNLIHVFPNPAEGYFFIRNEGTLNAEARIFNVAGQFIDILPLEAGQTTTSQFYEPGIYFMQIKNMDGETGFKKILIR